MHYKKCYESTTLNDEHIDEPQYIYDTHLTYLMNKWQDTKEYMYYNKKNHDDLYLGY